MAENQMTKTGTLCRISNVLFNTALIESPRVIENRSLFEHFPSSGIRIVSDFGFGFRTSDLDSPHFLVT